MNKAFVREPDPGNERCPRCGAPGEPVHEETLAAQLPADRLADIAKTANFCATPGCEVVYFDMFERVILAASLAQPVYPKDPQAPICACFGLTTDQIDEDIAEGSVARTRAAVERAKSAAADCRRRSPRGRSCIADVQRYYMQRKGG